MIYRIMVVLHYDATTCFRVQLLARRYCEGICYRCNVIRARTMPGLLRLTGSDSEKQADTKRSFTVDS